VAQPAADKHVVARQPNTIHSKAAANGAADRTGGASAASNTAGSGRGPALGHPIYFLETFVDPERFRGTCYRPANWVLLGKTTGRGKQSNSYVPNRSIKEILGYPLTKRFRELLGE
jgi:hypothetical protein